MTAGCSRNKDAYSAFRNLSLRAKRGNLVIVAGAVGVALCLLALLAGGESAHACTCAPSGSPEEALAEADAVFAGEATSVKVHGGPFRRSSADPVTVEFKVSRVWKGPHADTLTVETVRSEMSCGFEFKKGRKYIVYTYGGETGLCTRTAPTWMAFRDFAMLGEGWRPETPSVSDGDTPAAESANGGGCHPAAHGGRNQADVAMLGLLAGLAWFGIRRRTSL